MDNSETALANWSNYETVTLPSLQDVLNNLAAATTATVTTAAGAVGMTLGQLFSYKTLDLLTLSYAAGPTCDPIIVNSGDFPNWAYGAIVRTETIPDYMAVTSPDSNYYGEALCVFNVIRGEDLVFSKTIHYASEMISPLPWLNIPWVEGVLNLPILPPDMTFQVFWNTGCCGSLYFMVLP
jgi:hypothetical protein